MTPRRASIVTKPASKKVASNPISARKSAASASSRDKPLKAIFHGKSICSVGTIIGSGKSIQHEDIARWVRQHGGEYVKEVTDSTTHLIVSIEDFKKKGEQVQRALRLGKRRCHIVVYDWLEDCLIGGKTKRLLHEKPYTLDRVLNRIAQGKDWGTEYRKRFEDGVKASKELADNKLYSIYVDHLGFEYKVILTRVTLGEKIRTEKYTLYLFESFAIPHLHMVGAKLSRNGRPNSYWRDQCHAMKFEDAFFHFKHFFHEKTGVEWDMRLEPLPPKLKSYSFTSQNATIVEEAVKFKYARPEPGRPVGLLPLGYIPPEGRLVKVSEESSGESGSGSGSGSGSDGDDESGKGSGSGANTDTSGFGYDSDSEAESESEKDDRHAVPRPQTPNSSSARPGSRFNSKSFRGSERAVSSQTSNPTSSRNERLFLNQTSASRSNASGSSTRKPSSAPIRAGEVITIDSSSSPSSESEDHTNTSTNNQANHGKSVIITIDSSSSSSPERENHRPTSANNILNLPAQGSEQQHYPSSSRAPNNLNLRLQSQGSQESTAIVIDSSSSSSSENENENEAGMDDVRNNNEDESPRPASPGSEDGWGREWNL